MSGDSDDEIEPGTARLFGVPKGLRPLGRSGPMLRGALGQWIGQMREVEAGLVPLAKLDAIYKAVSEASLPPGWYFFNWLTDCFGYLNGEVSEIKEHVAEIERQLANVINDIQELRAWKDAQLIAGIRFVRKNLLVALSLPLAEAKDHIRSIYSNANKILETHLALVEMTLSKLSNADARRILCLDQLATFGGYEALILLLMGLPSQAVENLAEMQTLIENEAAKLIADWTNGVDLREAVDNKNELEKILMVMEAIDSKPASDRILDTYWSMPRLFEPSKFVPCTSIIETGTFKDSEEKLALVDRTLPALSRFENGFPFVRRGQIVGQYNPDFKSMAVVISPCDGYLFRDGSGDPRSHEVLAVDAPKLPIKDLARYVARLAETVVSMRNMRQQAIFAGEHPELAHELACVCLKRPEAQNGIVLRIPRNVSKNTIS